MAGPYLVLAPSYASMDLPQFDELICAHERPHHVEKATLKIDDPDSPLLLSFSPTGPYSRNKLLVLISIDARKTDLSEWQVRRDNDYGLIWIKSYGKHRVFQLCARRYCDTL